MQNMYIQRNARFTNKILRIYDAVKFRYRQDGWLTASYSREITFLVKIPLSRQNLIPSQSDLIMAFFPFLY